jgi:amidohydrolase
MSDCLGISTSEIRKKLHQRPEPSGEEAKTAESIVSYLSQIPDMRIHQKIGGHGIVAVKKYGPGKAVAYRAELDALPVEEKNDVAYRSLNEGYGHVCGHDGHMAMVLELACLLENAKPDKGTLVLLFQASEENGKGASAMVIALEEKEIELPTLAACFAIHNIPGEALGTFLIKEDSFACASVGVEVLLEGHTAHAAHPEHAHNPLLTAARLLQFGESLANTKDIDGFTLCTAIALHSGSDTFGTSPAQARLLLTLRAERSESLDKMIELFRKQVDKEIKDTKITAKMNTHEHFSATVNAKFNDLAMRAINNAEQQCKQLDEPFRWSEDFAQMQALGPIYLMGLGSGETQPALHEPNFDFPNALIPIGASAYLELYKLFIQ